MMDPAPPEDINTALLLLLVRNRRTVDRDTVKKKQKGGTEVLNCKEEVCFATLLYNSKTCNSMTVVVPGK
jgi:hypothetical protein